MVAVYVADTTCFGHDFLGFVVGGGGIGFGCKAAKAYMLIFVCDGGAVVYCAVLFLCFEGSGK